MNAALWRRIGIGAAVVVVLLLALWLARHIPKTIAIFVIAAFIAFGVQPIAARLERRMPKPLAISIVFLGLMIVVALFLVIVIPLTISQTQLLASNLPSYATTAQAWVLSAEASLERHFPTITIPAAELNSANLARPRSRASPRPPLPRSVRSRSTPRRASSSRSRRSFSRFSSFSTTRRSPRGLPRCFPRNGAARRGSSRPK